MARLASIDLPAGKRIENCAHLYFLELVCRPAQRILAQAGVDPNTAREGSHSRTRNAHCAKSSKTVKVEGRSSS